MLRQITLSTDILFNYIVSPERVMDNVIKIQLLILMRLNIYTPHVPNTHMTNSLHTVNHNQW